MLKEDNWWDSKEYQDYLNGETDHFSYDKWWEDYKAGKEKGIQKASNIEKVKEPDEDDWWLEGLAKAEKKAYKKWMKGERDTFKNYLKVEYVKPDNKNPNLVIHMVDASTDFLKPIYKSLSCDIVRGDVSKKELIETINYHKRIYMMGHGSPGGLFGKYGMIITPDVASELREKKDNVYIWCNADKFVESHKLHGFYTGMFVSEVGEARAMGIDPVPSQKEVDFSNDLYAKIVGSISNGLTDAIYEKVKREYNAELYPDNKVIAYNAQRQYKA